ncbi:MAG: hypothetical protein WCA51_08180, partial [Dehalococcoidia bacterium]
MLQNFLDGKKKYSAFIITALATMIPLFIQDPEAQKTVLDFVPSVAAALAGIFYIVTQGNVDKEKAKAVLATNGTTTSTQTAAEAQPAQPQQQTQPVKTEPPAEPLDLKLFHERVLNDTAAKYSEQNAATVFYTARDKGGLTTCHDIKQAQDYWDYLVTLAYDAEQYVKEATNAGKKVGGCTVRSPEHVQMQNELMKTIRYRDNVYALAQTNIDWRAKLGGNDTLLHVGALAEELL